jgi:hypothetical protein
MDADKDHLIRASLALATVRLSNHLPSYPKQQQKLCSNGKSVNSEMILR